MRVFDELTTEHGYFVDKHCGHDNVTKYIGGHQYYTWYDSELSTSMGERVEDLPLCSTDGQAAFIQVVVKCSKLWRRRQKQVVEKCSKKQVTEKCSKKCRIGPIGPGKVGGNGKK